MIIKKILFPTDFSEQANRSLPLATSLARENSALLLISHVIEPPEPMGVMVAHPSIPVTTLAEQKERLKNLRPADTSVRHEHRTTDGTPSDGIVKLAESEDVDLIVMSTHGRTGISRLLMGSVAEQVVRNATCPVLSFRPTAEKQQGQQQVNEDAGDLRIKSIVFPTDFSSCARGALIPAASLARDFKAELMIVHVQTPIATAAGGEMMAYHIPEPAPAELESLLADLESQASSVECSRHLVYGEAATQIEQFAKTHDADLIVMGTHGRTGLMRLLMGSVAESVMRRAPCPVVIIRPNGA